MFNSPISDVPTPPSVERQARLLQMPDDLRAPRDTAFRLLLPNSSVAAAPVVVTPLPGTAKVAVNAPMQAPAPAPAPAAAPGTISAPAPAATRGPAAAAPTAMREPGPMMFAPYLPSAKESQPPKSWEMAPKHDFPWVTGARPARVNEESTVGVGSRMFGRLFAEVEFGASATAQPSRTAATTEKPKLQASAVNCASTTCLDAARDMLLEDAQGKGWRMLLNRRVSLHQSFQFQRDDRVVWVEATSLGKNVLQLEYNLLPAQDSAAR